MSLNNLKKSFSMIKQKTMALATSLISTLESLRLVAYRDSAGIPTIGYGTTQIDGRKVNMFDCCTQEQAILWLQTRLETDFEKFESFCLMHDISLEDNQAATILSFIYNAGWNGFLSSSMARDLISKKTEKVTSDLLKWNKIRVDGELIFSAGLFNRRMKEDQCFVDERQCQ
jgi:lysozyme